MFTSGSPTVVAVTADYPTPAVLVNRCLRPPDEVDSEVLEDRMKLTQLFLDELDREAPRTRRAVERVPIGRDDWKPHPKSMPLARLAGLVASMPSWVTLIVEQDELDLTPPGGGQYQQPATDTLAGALD